jgi:two-component system, response regulator, stage 0 sporulation protein F
MMTADLMTKIIPVYEQRALILDDNEGNRTILKFVMDMNKIEHVEAANGQTALSVWTSGRFSYAFLDIELPDINGLEIARRMRVLDPGLAIIMCSTNDDPPTIHQAIEAGADIFFVKPFQLDTLISFTKMMDRCGLRNASKVLVVDNSARARFENRTQQIAGRA